MKKQDRVYVAVHQGMIGAAIVRRLEADGFSHIVTRAPAELDLTDQAAVSAFFAAAKPGYVFLPSAKIGGIAANSAYPAEFIYTNLQAEANVIHSAWKSGVKKLLFLASSCIYPRDCPQPMKEEYLMTGRVEPSSEPYAVAKIAGIGMCQAYRRQYGASFICAVPSDVYGPGDDFNPETGHVLPALISKMHDALLRKESEVTVWGSGSPRRECLHVDDLAEACLFLMEKYDDPQIINIGSGRDLSIAELAGLVKGVVGFRGELVFDRSKPDGAPRKLLDTARINRLGWSPRIRPEEGVRQTYRWHEGQAKITQKSGTEGVITG